MKSKEPNPPRWAERLLGSVCDPALREDLLGDLHERFIVRARSMSLFRAKIFYLWDVLIFLRPYVIRKDRDISLLFLLPVYLHAATRSLKKDALHSILTICGLSLSIIAFLFIAFFVDDELKYDRHYDKAERIYRISSEINSLTASTPVAATDGHLGQRLKYIYPTIEETVAMAKVQGKSTVRYGDHVSTEDNLYKAERTYFKIFSHHWIAGNPTTALGTPKSIVLTRRLSDKYFKDQPPLNKIVTIGQQAFTVTGVIEDLPSHTDLRFDALLSSDYQYLVETDYWCITFILARSRIDESLFQKKLVELSKLYLQNEVEGTGAEMIYRIERLPEVHFGKPKLFDTPKSSRSNIYVFTVIAFFILLIACINYTNLAVAKALRKTTEAGIRKMLGARSSQLVVQNISESFLLCGVSTFLAVLAVWILFPNFNNLTGKEMQFPEVVNFRIVMIIFLLLALTCIVSATYPATVWSSAKPVSEWNGPNKVVAKASIRNTLIIIQFTISIGLMICTKVVYDQWKLLSQNDPGFNKEQVLVADLPNDNSLSIAQIKNALSSLSFVKYVSAVGYNSLPSSSMDIDSYEVDMQGENVSRIFNNITVDENYIDLLEIEVTQGKNFTPRDIENDENYVLVNESLVQAMEWQDPLGQILYSFSTAYEVIGVVKDFHFNSLHKRIEPIIIHGGSKYPEKLMVKVNRADFQSIQTLEDTWKKSTGGKLHVEFLDSYFNEQYRNEKTMQRILVCFSVLTIIIACLGLSGLVALSTIRKAREFAIRKILGAEFVNIVFLIVKDFAQLLFVSIVLAIPISLLVISQWLQQFSYKTELTFIDCLSPILIAVIIAVVSTSYFVFQAALTNPIKSIKKVSE